MAFPSDAFHCSLPAESVDKIGRRQSWCVFMSGVADRLTGRNFSDPCSIIHYPSISRRELLISCRDPSSGHSQKGPRTFSARRQHCLSRVTLTALRNSRHAVRVYLWPTSLPCSLVRVRDNPHRLPAGLADHPVRRRPWAARASCLASPWGTNPESSASEHIRGASCRKNGPPGDGRCLVC